MKNIPITEKAKLEVLIEAKKYNFTPHDKILKLLSAKGLKGKALVTATIAFAAAEFRKVHAELTKKHQTAINAGQLNGSMI